MATKKKTKKKSTRSKKIETKKAPAKQAVQKRRTSKKLAKTHGEKTKIGINRKSRSERRQPGSSNLPPEPSGLQSGDLQGLSNVESVDSESVDELLEEGNSFEAGIVA